MFYQVVVLKEKTGGGGILFTLSKDFTMSGFVSKKKGTFMQCTKQKTIKSR